ncbi:MAG: Ku protein [Solirubrobacteraceae bacterium]|nr:Ku protein [Solirubrobacteraceae bacterium]
MARSIWTGTISFGLVTIPVKLYPAVQRRTVRFNQLDGEDRSRIQQKRVNSRTGEEVPYERLVKGYEIAPDQYVVIEPGELEALDPRRTRTIEIEDFVEAGEIDPILYDATYHVAPAPGGAKPYRLLAAAMRETGKVAIARIVLRTKEYLVALRPAGEGLELSTMLFSDEVVDAGSIDELAETADIEVSAREVEVARQLIASLEAAFDPSKYHDEYRARVLDLIERKAQGEEIAIAPAPEEQAAPLPDLMSALKASLDAVRAERPEAPAPKPARRRSTAAKKPAAGGRAAKKPAAKKPRA